ncbi:acetyl-CoA synthetase-like protein [Martensiomyces pterosporus]|nr:acetyl-CoA synthetase-like protein [Martensiomyces pterosporus]
MLLLAELAERLIMRPSRSSRFLPTLTCPCLFRGWALQQCRYRLIARAILRLRRRRLLVRRHSALALLRGLQQGYTNHNGSDNGFDLEVDSSDPRVVGTNYPAQYPSSSSRPSATARDASLSLPNTAPLEGPSVVIAGLSPAPASAPLLDTPMANLPPASNEYEQQDYGQWQPGTYDASTTQPSALSSIGAIVYPREIPEDVSSHQLKQLMALHQNLPSVLRHRAATTPNAIAYTCIDTKGKEIGSWTWSGLHTRAIHVVQLLRQKGVSVWGDRVALVYRKYEMLEFVGSLFGCFYAGLCAVPIVAGDSYAELVHVLNSTSAVLVLTSELNVKSLNKDLNQNNVGPGWPTDVAWVRTDNLGGCTLSSIGAQSPSSQYHPRQAADNYYSSKTDTKIDDIGPDDIAYIEFSKSPNGELKGVQVTHGAIMTQCAGWMMSTGMLGVGRKYKHRVELEQDEPASASYYSQAIVDPNNELGADSPPSTPSSALGTPAVAGLGKYSSTAASSPVAEQEHHHGSFGKKWGSSSGFLGRLRNVGSLPRIRKGSRAKDHPVQSGGSPRMSTTSVRNSMASQTVADGRARAASSTSASQQQRLQQGDDGLGLSPGSIQKNPTRLSAVSRATTINNAGGSLDAGNDSASRPRGASSTSPPAAKDVVVFYIEPRQHFGLVYGILGGCYGGHQSVYTSSALCDIPGAYINLLTRYWATVAVGDYTGLQSVLSAATDEPSQITDYSKKTPPNLASLRLCLVDTLFIDPVFHTTFNRNVLHPFGCPYQSIADAEGHPVMTAVCTLAEHGSVLMAMRDCLSSCTPPNVDDGPGMGYEFVLDREAFKENRVVILPDERNEAEVDRIGTVRYQSFGFPALNATIAVVDPETRELCAPDSIGELWIASPSLGSGFWGLPKLTSSIFAARFTYSVEQDVELVSSSTYLRTGLMGALVLGRVLVFGFYEDRIRTLTIEPSPDVPVGTPAWYIEPTLGFHYAGDINSTIRRYLPQISECTAFEMFANETHFPVIAAEVRHNSGMFSTIAEEVYGVLRNRHGLYAYAVALCPPNTLPRAFQYGKRTVNAQLCRHQFESGKINCLYVKISTDNLFMNLPPPASTLPEGQFGDIEDPSVALYGRWLQQTSLEEGMPSVDERSGTDLCTFGSITEILIWRAAKYPEEIAYSQFDERGRVAKSLTFQKLLTKVSAVAQLMLEKKRVGAGDHVLVVMTPSPSFVVAIHACLAIGAVPIPIAPPDVNRLSDDMPPLLATAREFRVNYMLVNAHSEDIFRSKMMEGAMRAQALRSLLGSHRMPGVIAVTKASKSPKYLLGRGSFKFSRQWSEPTRTALVMQFTGTQASTPQYVSYTHRAILGFCSQQKGDFQMLHSLPVIASVRAYNGYGLLHCSMIGIYVGCMTLLLSPVDFFSSPNVWFELVQRYKVKDAFTTLPMLQHAMNSLSAHGGQLGFSLHAVRNFILATEERVDPATYLAVRDFFARARLDEMAVNPLYGTLMNPCISTRAYLGVSPLTLRLDTHAMRRGRVVALPPLTEMDGAEDAELHSLTLQDSGKVSGSTMVAIVDPVTRQALPAGCIGEVWVCSSSNASKKQTLVPGVVSAGGKAGRPAMAMSNSTGYLDGSKDSEFVRTGDLGFLYLQVSEDDQDGAPAEPYLFVAGRVAETFNVDEYLYFYSDIERAVEESSSDLVPGGCVVLQTTIQSSYSSNSGGGNLDGGNSGGRSRDAPTESSRLRLVAVISLRRSPSDSFLPNAACLIFNSVLDRHQVLLDEIVFVPRDSLPRSRISERRRRTVRGLYESGKLNAFVSYPISNSPTLSSGIANPNNRQSFVGPPAGNSSALAFLNDSSSSAR